ncbi:hypothetical protein ACHFJ0_05075 [Paracoccus sp. NGMCC 1.201697]|uniref:Uncharacterized protein n=1 Tax=Paracoccus broussonetiae subsp. drimophilus TaxID=3373869 RepID=A0ABW7LJN5_9RHOB
MNAHTGNMIARMAASGQSLPDLVSRASRALAEAQSSAEVLEARDMASVVYDAAKKAARMAQAKGAHDALIAAAHRAQADALLIESEAKRRLADEYDAAQERGEVATKADQNLLPDQKKVTVVELGLTHKQVHEARQIRDAEVAQPGIVKETLDKAISERREPTRAELQRSIVAAASQAMRGGSRKPRNPDYKPDPFFAKIAHFSGICEEIGASIDMVERFAAYTEIESTRNRLRRNVAAALLTLRRFEEVSHA